jgi:membrane-bound lytic murein transglycosylase D
VSWVELARVYLGLQLSVVVGALVSEGLVRLRLEARGTLWICRALLATAVLLPLAAAWLPGGGPIAPPVQVWSEFDTAGGTVVQVAAPGGGGTDAAGVTASAAVVAPLAAAMLVAVLALAGVVLNAWLRLRSLVRGSVRWRRIGRVELRVSPRVGSPLAVRLPGRVVVLLDEHTFSDPLDRGLAVRHELQHHRQGDTAFAYLLTGLRVLCLANPMIHLWVHRLQGLEELACDAALVRGGQVSPLDYGSCLVRAARRSTRSARPLAAGMSPAASRSMLKRRIDMLSSPRTTTLATLVPIAAACAALMVATAWAGDGLVSDRRIDPDEVRGVADRASTADFEVPANDEVLETLNRYYAGTDRGRRFCRRALADFGVHEVMVLDALQRYGLPRQLTAIPLVESGYRNLPQEMGESTAPPGPMGAGIWMFIPQTARAYGMRVDDEDDDRLDEEIETDAAMRLLGDLYEEFGDWPLAMAGYNQGARRVRSAIETQGTDDPWALVRAGALNDYAARVMAVAIVMEQPALVDAPSQP